MEGKATISFNERQLGTLIAFMQANFSDREAVKEVANRCELKHLDDINEEFRLLMSLETLRQETFKKIK